MKYETDSRKVKPGQIFVAIKGHTVDGHDYIESAIKNGAVSLITEVEVDASVPYQIVPSSEEYLKEQLDKEYSSQFKDLKIVGVTGTNGKTTTCYLIYQTLKKLGKKVAYIGTIGFYCDDSYRELDNTTPDILTLYKLLFEALDNKVEYVVMEVSSHALSLERIKGVSFDVAAFTNLSQDHLDFHNTMDEYLTSKMLITKYLKDQGTLILNSDDDASLKFNYNNSLTVGKNGSYQIINYSFNADSTEITFSYLGDTYKVTSNLINDFNVYNYLMNLAIVNNLGFEIEEIINVTKEVYPPKGRCETINVNNNYAVIDFAHTPDAVEKIIKAYQDLNFGRVITVLGCGGDRDPKKRPIMGKIACDLSDEVIFTSDNPRTEDPLKILDDIVKDNNSSNYKVIEDRKDAIITGLDLLKENDFLLILGKGHENYQIIGHEKIHFDDAEIVRDYLTKNN